MIFLIISHNHNAICYLDLERIIKKESKVSSVAVDKNRNSIKRSHWVLMTPSLLNNNVLILNAINKYIEMRTLDNPCAYTR